MARVNTKATKDKCRARTSQIVVGQRYFLSSFYDKSGAWVRVTGKSTKTNSAGWPSSVEYLIEEPVNESPTGYYAVGKAGSCNAMNLYTTREGASHLIPFAVRQGVHS